MSTVSSDSPKDAATYVVLVTGTFNPPHIGHVKIGDHAVKHLQACGHTVRKVIYSPVHDNYVVNKILHKNKVKSRVDAKGDGSSSSSSSSSLPMPSPDSLFFPMSERVRLLERMLKISDEEASSHAAPSTRVERSALDYEHKRPDLLQESRYWAERLPDGYLKTVPTAALVKAFSDEYTKGGNRVAVVFGADLLAYMTKWKNVGSLFRSCDLLIVGRQVAKVSFTSDPKDLLGNFKAIHVEYPIHLTFNETTVVANKKGTITRDDTKTSTLHILPPLPKVKEQSLEDKSSTKIRKAISDFFRTLGQCGYDPELVVELLGISKDWKSHLLRAKDSSKDWIPEPPSKL